MSLSSDLVSQFVKATKDNRKTNSESTVYGTTVIYDSKTYVKLDGSDLLTPVNTTTNAKSDERVTVRIKDHTATITGNISSPAASTNDVKEIGNKITDVETLVADKVSTKELESESARIDTLVSENVTIKEKLTASEAEIDDLVADNVTINNKLTAQEANIKKLETEKLSANSADIKFATIDSLDALEIDVHNLEATYGDFKELTTNNFAAVNATIETLDAKKLDVESAEVTYANIDFANISEAAVRKIFGETGLIKDLTVGDQTITGELIGVTISGDLIKANTLKADKLVVKGSDGLYYKLNIEAGAVESAEVSKEELQNGLHGTAIIAKTITADKISVTDLVAFGATIGGYSITNNALYSGVKNTVDNTTAGVYLDSDGQMAIGDANNFLKYYVDANGNYILEVSADSIRFGASKKTIENAIDDISVGGRNLLLNSEDKLITSIGNAEISFEREVTVSEWNATNAIRAYGTATSSSIFGRISGTSGSDLSNSQLEYASSVYVKNNHQTNKLKVTLGHVTSCYRILEPLEIGRVELIGNGNGYSPLEINFAVLTSGDDFDITYWHPKIEHGNKVTDWTPAPEDMASTVDVTEVRNEIESVDIKVNKTQSLIEQLSDSISTLVTDGNGTSLMTQTESGWIFSTAEIQSSIASTAENLNALTDEFGNTNSVVSVLQQTVDDLGEIADYVKIGTYEDEPCIELGEGDSDFKLYITNTRIMFVDGTTTVAYINNKSLRIKTAVIEGELQQGGFAWKIRNNGNMGLIWKGAID